VVGLSRSAPAAEVERSRRGCPWIRHDLAGADELVLDRLGIDAAIHLAAGLAGSEREQTRATILATRHLAKALHRAGIGKLVGVSSLVVLDYASVPALSLVDERTPTASGAGMGIYARMKLEQERLFAGFAGEAGGACAILRPGLVYDSERLSAAHAGIIKGSVRLLVAHPGRVPVIEVRGLARAIVNAAELDTAGGEILHLVDDNLPGVPAYVQALRRRGLLQGSCIPIPWRMMAAMALLVRSGLAAAGLTGAVPEAMLRHGFAARLKPFHYSNDKARRTLGWVPASRFA
jgi:nucleoside-diphosphate-sugar epimerase